MPNTINVTIRAIDQNGQPLAYAPISARLTNLEVTENLGYVIQESNAVVADANGVAVMALWPNALGSTESSYKFTIRNPNNWQTETIIATLPNNDCELHNVADLPAYPGKTDGQLAVEEAIAAVAPALEAKIAAQTAALEAGISATEAAESAAITSSFDITIGTVTEGNVGATLTGTSPNRVLNLVIPKGDTGDKGDTGLTGNSGADGTDGVDGVDGKTAYQLALDAGFTGNLNQWLLSLKGDKGDVGNTGLTGDIGLTGAAGKSAYQAALDNGFVGTLSAWLASLIGPQGIQGLQGIQGIPGNNGADGTSFTVNATGLLVNRSTYDAQAAGFSYLATDTGNLYIRQGASGWSAAIPFGKGETGAQGIPGVNGTDGIDGTNGADGLSAYQIAVNAGFSGNQAAWLLSLKGETGAAGLDGVDGTNGINGTNGVDGIDGSDGLSAYQIAVNAGFSGNQAAWLASLVGPAGADGVDGINGTNGIDGTDGVDGAAGTTTWAGITDKPTFAAVATSGLKADVGLGNVDNTPDVSKPVSTAQAAADALVASNAATDATTKANIAEANAIAASTPAAHVGTGGTAHANAIAGGAAGFMSGADKTKLDGVASGANNYTHPADHPPSIIAQDSSNRFVTDAEKTAWNAKQDTITNSDAITEGATNLFYTTARSALKQDASAKDASGGFAGLTLFKINFKNALNTFTSFFTNSNTAVRTYLFPDKDGTVAMTSDITGVNSGTNTGDEDLASIKSKLGITTLSGSNTGDQTLGSLGGEGTVNKDANNGYVGLTLFKINFKNVANTITSFFTNTNTVARTYTFQDRDGTIADNTDIATRLPLAGGKMTGAFNEATAVTIATAATMSIGAVAANTLKTTGTVTVTSLGTGNDGDFRRVIFGGAGVLTHNATSLILPTAANITTAVDDVGEFISLGGSNWKCLNYGRKSGAALVSTDSTKLPLVGGTMTGQLVEKLATAIASAATINISTANGNAVHITGTTGITAMTVASGNCVKLIFDGILTITHNGTSLILPGAANITTAAGDTCWVVGDGTNARILGFQRANGQPVNKNLLGYTEVIYALAGTVIDPANGSVQTKTLASNTTFTESIGDGQCVLLMLNPSTFTTTWPTTSWINTAGTNTAPTLKASAMNSIVLWQVGGVLYGNWIGSL